MNERPEFAVDRDEILLHKSKLKKGHMKKMNQKKEEAFFNRSLERALQILNVFDFKKKMFTLTQLCEALILPRATVFRLSRTLIKYGFLAYDQESKTYSLGHRLPELGRLAVTCTPERGPVKGPAESLIRFFRREGFPIQLMEDEGDKKGRDSKSRAEEWEIPKGGTSDICDAAVMIMSDPIPDQKICTYIVIKPGATINEIVAFLNKRDATARHLPEKGEEAHQRVTTNIGDVDRGDSVGKSEIL